MTTTPLEELAVAADAVADDQRQVADTARELAARRKAGWSWSRILESEEGPQLVELVRRSVHRLREASGRLTSVLAAELSNEGRSRREIARWLGVSHQRVSALVERTRSTSKP